MKSEILITPPTHTWDKNNLLGVYLNYRVSERCSEYAHVISLGHACAVASEIERFGLRSHSGPFDWQGTRCLKSRIDCIQDGFSKFMENLRADKLWQRQVPSCYLMKELGIFLVHDFNEWSPIEKQLPKVRKKYESRIKNFMHDITEPTLFLYYLCAEDDVAYINSKCREILDIIKAFNPNNDIVFIADEKFKINIPCFYVKNDRNSDIADRFSDQNKELFDFIEKIPYSEEKKKNNIVFYNIKQRKKYINKLKKKVLRMWNFYLRGTYHHDLTFFD